MRGSPRLVVLCVACTVESPSVPLVVSWPECLRAHGWWCSPHGWLREWLCPDCQREADSHDTGRP